MKTRNLPISSLLVNRANDRHGELENETAAIAWLFSEREAHMKNLAKDIVSEGRVYELPLVSPQGDKFLVFDGNRRVTCIKLLAEPRRAPTQELQEFFKSLRKRWEGTFPKKLLCQVELNREEIDEILYRRHTGSQSGVGQSKWDDRMKANFVGRTGKGSGNSVADEVEARLEQANLLPTRRKIPRSTMNRLLSAEPYRNRLGFSVKNKRFQFTHEEGVVLSALARIADDMANRRLVLGNIWDVDGKTAYLDKLEEEGVLPSDAQALGTPKSGGKPKAKAPSPKPSPAPKPTPRPTLIPQVDYSLVWPGRLQRHHAIWNELQFELQLNKHPNAVSVLFRVLLELSAENYIEQTGLQINVKDKLSTRIIKIGRNLKSEGKIDDKQLGILTKFQHADKLVSADTLNRYVHSPNFAPSPEHLKSMWDSLSSFIVHCLQA